MSRIKKTEQKLEPNSEIPEPGTGQGTILETESNSKNTEPGPGPGKETVNSKEAWFFLKSDNWFNPYSCLCFGCVWVSILIGIFIFSVLVVVSPFYHNFCTKLDVIQKDMKNETTTYTIDVPLISNWCRDLQTLFYYLGGILAAGMWTLTQMISKASKTMNPK